MENKKIVLVGGPCGGKTQSLEFFQKELRKESPKVETIPEIASQLFQIGYAPNENISFFDFQNLLFKIQFLKEYQKEGIILCDRGLLDGEAYIGEEFSKVLERNYTKKEDVLSTYHCALYLKSIAYEDPERFIQEREFETIEKAKARDQAAKRIWNRILIGEEIDNSISFEEKQRRLLFLLKKEWNGRKTKSLKELFDEEYVRFQQESIESFLKEKNIEEERKEKTRRLIR